MTRVAPTSDAGFDEATSPEEVGDVNADGRRTSSEESAIDLIPGWLALLVLVLLLAVAVLGGYLIRGMVSAPKASTSAGFEITTLEKKITADPNNIEDLLSLGYAYQQDGRYDEAVATYDQVLALDAVNSGAMYNKAIVLMKTNKPKEGEALLWTVLKTYPDHALAAKALGEYYVGKKQYKSALVALEPAAKIHPEFADLQYLAGYACEQLNIKDTAIAYYRGALKYNPDYQEAKDGLARLGASERQQ